MLAILAAIFFGVKLIFDLVAHMDITEVMEDCGLLALALHFALGHVVPIPWRRAA